MTGDTPPPSYAFEGHAVVENLEAIHRLIAQAGADHPEIPEADLMMFETAVTEIAGNVIEHGEPPGQVDFMLAVQVGPDRLVATLRDTGAEFDPDLSADMPDPDTMLEGGRGVPISRAVLDELEFRREDGCNIWWMVRNVTFLKDQNSAT